MFKTKIVDEWEGEGFYLAQFKTPQLSICSYYVESCKQALLIDPTYDTQHYKQLSVKRQAKVICIAMTHYHEDYIGGHTQFDLPVLMGPHSCENNKKIKIIEMKDGYEFNLGSIWLKIHHTPGHTLESCCFEVIDKKKQSVALFTGDTLLMEDVGQPYNPDCRQKLLTLMFQSLQKIKKGINGKVRVYGGHGGGSWNWKNIKEGNFSTLQEQVNNNPYLKVQTCEQFIEKMQKSLVKIPPHFVPNYSINKNGTAPKYENILAQCNTPLSIQQFSKFLQQGSTCMDTRNFPLSTVKNCYLVSEKGMLTIWTAFIASPNQSIVFITDTQQSRDIIVRLLRIGYFNIKGYNNFTIDEWKNGEQPTWMPKYIKIKDLLEDDKRIIVDVRNQGEWKNGIVEGAKTINLGEISDRWKELQGMSNLYFHCRSAMRGNMASSILARNGIQSTAILDEFPDFEPNGLKIVQYE